MAPLSLAFTALPIVFPSGCFSLSCDPGHSGCITGSVYCSSAFPALSHFDPFVHDFLISWKAHVLLSIWAAPTDSWRLSLLATFSPRTLSLLFPKPRLKARALHFVLTRVCPHLSYVTHHTLSFLFHCRSSRTGITHFRKSPVANMQKLLHKCCLIHTEQISVCAT